MSPTRHQSRTEWEEGVTRPPTRAAVIKVDDVTEGLLRTIGLNVDLVKSLAEAIARTDEAGVDKALFIGWAMVLANLAAVPIAHRKSLIDALKRSADRVAMAPLAVWIHEHAGIEKGPQNT